MMMTTTAINKPRAMGWTEMVQRKIGLYCCSFASSTPGLLLQSESARGVKREYVCKPLSYSPNNNYY
eukprot:2817494-Amphidinium_carterae.1